MSDAIITVENLGKKYRIVHERQDRGSATLREALTNKGAELVRALVPGGRRRSAGEGNGQPRREEFWALRNVGFDVKQGEVVGIIGRNGAGKSTLLKILSRITEPTEGRVSIKGRVASLLEVGTGFHPELTGRENIYLNGAILGMTRGEIKRKFDEIIDFAGVEKFLDTPVKRYSSGMYVRLAFAVAAHLESEILVIDEVLTVGDTAFQKKCLGKIGDVAGSGRTILLVSHNMASVLSLCSRALWLNSGKVASHGATSEIVQTYLKSSQLASAISLDQRQDRSGDGSVRLISLHIHNADGDSVIHSTSRLSITLHYRSYSTRMKDAAFHVGVYDLMDRGVFLLSSEYAGGLPQVLPPEGTVTCVTDRINLTPGRCYVNIALLRGGVMADYIQNAAEFDVETTDVYGTGRLPSRDWVLCVLKHRWSLTV